MTRFMAYFALLINNAYLFRVIAVECVFISRYCSIMRIYLALLQYNAYLFCVIAV